VTRITILLQL